MKSTHSNLDKDSDGDSWKPRHNHKSNADSPRRHHRDDSSVDSGYYGSRASTQGSSPRSPVNTRKQGPRDLSVSTTSSRHERQSYGDRTPRSQTAKWEDASSSDSGSDDDDDYNPKAKYYMKLKDDDYKNISFRGEEENSQSRVRQSTHSRRRRSHDERSTSSSPRHDHHHHRSPTSPSGRSEKSERRSSRHSSRRHSDSEPAARHRRDSYHQRRALSPVPSEQSEGWETSTEQAQKFTAQSPTSPHNDENCRRSLSSKDEDAYLKSPTSPGRQRRRSPTRDAEPREGSHQGSIKSKRSSSSPSSSPISPSSPRGKLQSAAADLNDAWYKTFKERLVKGVDMAQVKKVGLEAAAVAAIKVAVGTQMPWKQRVPKTIATGLAAAVTDFLVSKSVIKPKGMMGTMFARQFVEIALANLVVNPVSNKVTGKVSNIGGRIGGGLGGGGGKRR